jgi:DNA-binding transcriptional MerR regulator
MKTGSKVYYTIGEVAKMFNVKESVIRYWENTYDILKPHRNKKNNRLFTESDLETIHLIYHLSKERGMKHDGIRKKLKENREGTKKHVEIVRRLQSIRSILVKINDTLQCEQQKQP